MRERPMEILRRSTRPLIAALATITAAAAIVPSPTQWRPTQQTYEEEDDDAVAIPLKALSQAPCRRCALVARQRLRGRGGGRRKPVAVAAAAEAHHHDTADADPGFGFKA